MNEQNGQHNGKAIPLQYPQGHKINADGEHSKASDDGAQSEQSGSQANSINEQGQENDTSTHPLAAFQVSNPDDTMPTQRQSVGGPGERALARQLLREIESGRWGLENEERQEVVAILMADIRKSRAPRTHATLAKTLGFLDNIDRGREKLQLDSKQGEEKDERERVRILLQSTALRQQTADATARLTHMETVALESQAIEGKHDKATDGNTDTGSPDSAAVG